MTAARQLWTRRRALFAAGATLGAAGVPSLEVLAADAPVPEGPSLAALAAARGLMLGASFATHELDQDYAARYAGIYQRDCAILASELELKLLILRPDAGTLDFASADRLVMFAENNGKKIHGHTLIWDDNVPAWIKRLTASEIEFLLETHIETVMERYQRQIQSWDVVNEPIGPWDRQPGNLRRGPFLMAMGESYIGRSFRVARKVAPHATLILNEAQTESDDNNGHTFRTSLMALLKRLKDGGAPIDRVGLQCHIDSARPYDFPRFAAFVEEIAALGFGIAISELDVNDRALSADIEVRDHQVADIYRRFLKAVLPVRAVKSLVFWQLADCTSWMYYDDRQKFPDAMRRPRPLPYDASFKRKPAWLAVAEQLDAMPAR